MNSTKETLPESRLVSQLKDFYEAQGYYAARELNVGYGRADLVAFAVNFRKVKSRLYNGQLRSLSRIEHYSIIGLLPEIESGESLAIDSIADALPQSSSYVQRKILPHLARFGYIKETEPGRFAKVNGFIPIVDEIIAIEAKISDWRKGAVQAKRYQVFANRTYLAVASKFQHRVDRRVLQQHRIGLLSVSSNEIIELLAAPQLKPRDIDRSYFAAEWLWRYRRRELREGARIESGEHIP